MKVAFIPILLALVAPAAGKKVSAVKGSSFSEKEQNEFLAIYASKASELQRDHEGRELIFDDLCSDIVAGFIGPIGGLVGTNITCDCGLDLIPPGISVGCSSGSPVCFVPPDIVCGLPGLSFSLDILSIFSGGFPFGAEICYDNLKIGGIIDLSSIPFCLGLSPTILGFLGIGANTGVEGDSDATECILPENVDNKCDAKIGDVDCNSCEVCASGNISFNCTNVYEGFYATNVDVGVIPSTFSDILRVNEVQLSIDGFE